jgi:hypothetical protein
MTVTSALMVLSSCPRADADAHVERELRKGVDRVDTTAAVAAEEEHNKRLDYVALPIPILEPTLGEGLALVGAALYDYGIEAPPSFTGALGLYTSNDSWLLGAIQGLHTDYDTWRIRIGAAGYELNTRYYDTGRQPGQADDYLGLRHRGWGAMVKALREIGSDVFLGAQLGYIDNRISVQDSSADADGIEVPQEELATPITALTLLGEWDRRDSTHYPGRGYFVDAKVGLSTTDIPGNGGFQTYTLAYNHYFGLSEQLVLGTRATMCSTQGDTPFFALCMLGAADAIRGYRVGQYRARRGASLQAEVRWRFWHRFGLVAFGGGAWSVNRFSDISMNSALPSYGVGVRFLASQKHGLNVGVDYGRGDDSDGWYFRLGEAF